MATFTPAAYLDYIREPGRGWGSGCHIGRVTDRTIGGVHFTVATVVDNRNGARERLYLTDDGFIVAPVVDAYARWAITSRHDGIRGYQRANGWTHVGVEYASNLARAAATITAVRDWARTANHPLTPEDLP